VNIDFPPRFSRTSDLYGPEAFARLRRGGALVVGLGGVGAHCVVALARTGIGRLKILDCDRVTTSSLNRHPLAAAADVGRLKTEILAAWIAAACPDTQVEGIAARVDAASLTELIPPAERELFPVLIDCIDEVEAKVALLTHGVRHGWRVLSSMGAAGKRDGGQLRRGDLFESQVCPLARAVRQRLRRQGIGPGRIEAVWSLETPVPPVAGSRRTSPEAPTPGHSTRRQPSNQMLPGMVGFALAARAVDLLSDGMPPAAPGAPAVTGPA
jgi:tRNA threonylcarbamoyladenosine dehydratase